MIRFLRAALVGALVASSVYSEGASALAIGVRITQEADADTADLARLIVGDPVGSSKVYTSKFLMAGLRILRIESDIQCSQDYCPTIIWDPLTKRVRLLVLATSKASADYSRVEGKIIQFWSFYTPCGAVRVKASEGTIITAVSDCPKR